MNLKIQNTFKPLIFLFVAIVMLTLSVAVQAWTPPPATPPSCPSGTTGCDAPLNIGSLLQVKSGPLASTKFSVNKLTEPPAGYIMDVVGAALVDGLSVNQNAVVNGRVTTKNLKVTEVPGIAGITAGMVLMAKDSTGEAGWGTVTGGSSATQPVVTNYTAMASNGNTVNTPVSTHDACFITGTQYFGITGEATGSCYIGSGSSSSVGLSLNAYAGTGDTIYCTASCLDF